MKIYPFYSWRVYVLRLFIWTCVAAAYTQPGENEAHSACPFKTVNYITHTLPQQCLRASWPTPVFTQPSTPEWPTASTTLGETDLGPSDAAAPLGDRNNPILSFEEWKELMLRQRGQDPQEMQRRPPGSARHRSDHPVDLSLDSLGDDAEIPLNFEVLSDYRDEPSNPPIQPQASDEPVKVLYDDGKTQYYRSKDAGKTCKERFSYSSFDAGATVLKTSPGTKNAKAILLENKDSYMLFECQAEEKYAIVELSDDILVDTVVLANFEFFSSMVRHFRVSVSDRYPVKADKWRFLGTFEAKNSRDIQPFLVDNPQIWAKYVRVEFITHYGNEYFCPVSLLRVHGTRMMESWKETEPGAEEEDFSGATNLRRLEGAPPNDESGAAIIGEYGLSPLPDVLLFSEMLLDETCPAFPATAGHPSTITAREPSMDASGRRRTTDSSDVPRVLVPDPNQDSASTSLRPRGDTPASTDGETPTLVVEEQARSANVSSNFASETTSSSSQLKAPEIPATHSKDRTTTAAANSPAPPIVQDSFFKTITKRLQLLEANVTWTLKYVEDQSKYFQEAFVRIEERRLFKLEDLMESFNRTVRAELDGLQQQYDQIWQSTVIALETQREHSQSELVALSSRLNVLADEVVFQKRMSIGQSVLLLSCLVLIIFSRSIANASTPLLWQSQADAPFLDKDSLSRMLTRVNRPNLSLGSPLRSQQTLPTESSSPVGCHNDAFEDGVPCRRAPEKAELLCQSQPFTATRREYPPSPQSQPWEGRGDLCQGLPKPSRIKSQVDDEIAVPFSTSRSRKPLPPLPE